MNTFEIRKNVEIKRKNHDNNGTKIGRARRSVWRAQFKFGDCYVKIKFTITTT